MTFILSASILSADFANLQDQIRACENAGVDWIHVDVMDGHFAPNITMGPFIVEAVRKMTDLPLDVHLMIEKPEKYVGNFIDAGANYLSIHIEGNPHVHRTIEVIRELGAHPGIVINPGTSALSIEETIPYIDYVLIMTVNPGFSGQKFIPGMLPKIRKIREMVDSINPNVFIEVDGGITRETLPQCYHAGVKCFVAATAIFKHPTGINDGVRVLRSSVVVK